MAEAPDTARARLVDQEDQLRAELYALLAGLFRAPPGAGQLARLGRMSGDESPLGTALGELAEAARAASPEAVDEEFFELFIGVGRGELLPYASYYMTGFLNERPLAKLRYDMAELGIARADGVHETEDHIAALCEMMAGLIVGAFGEPAGLAAQRRLFDRHIAPWATRFFEDLEAAAPAAFYAPVAKVGKLFMRIEAQGFEMAA